MKRTFARGACGAEATERGLRLFFAVPLPAALAAALEPVARRLAAAGWRAVAASERHLTVRFLGDRPAGDVAALLGAAARAVEGIAPFVLELGGVGAFPHARRPDVAFAACTAGTAEFQCLAAALAAPRRAAPHVTLARRPARLPPAEAAAGWAECAAAFGAAAWGRLAVTEVVLLRSELGAGRPRYHPLGCVTLGALAPPGTGRIP